MRKILIIFLVIAALAALPGIGLYGARSALRGDIRNLLLSYGFTKPVIGDVTYKNGYLVFRDIRLDPDAFSTISDIQIPAGYRDLILRKKPETVIVNAVKLTGAYNKEADLDISGWIKRPLPLPKTDRLVLNGGQLDLDTAAGGLRFQAKGEIARQENGVHKLRGSLWAEQNQLTAHTVWTGEIGDDGRWVYDVDIQDAALNLERVQGSRLTGWLVFDKSKEIIPSVSGQIEAGKLTFGNVSLMNGHWTVSGPINLVKLIGTGKIGGYENMTFSLEISSEASGPFINATVETKNLDNMVDFLSRLQGSDAASEPLTSLLLTPGNLDRLRSEIGKLGYDALELQISGPLYDLAGKVIARRYKDGVAQNNVISLDPGTDMR